MHESFDRTHDVAESSERSFGLVFCGALTVVGVLRLWRGHPDGYACLSLALVFALLALFWTAPLVPLNRLWAGLGRLLHAVVTPVLMGVLFFGALMPLGLLVRLLGKDILNLRRDRVALTYWVARSAVGSRPGAMKDQF